MLPFIAFVLIPRVSYINLLTISHSFALPFLYAFIHAVPSDLNIIHSLLPFHHSLLFLMNSYTSSRVQLKCQHCCIVLLKLCPNPFPHRPGSSSFSVSPLRVLYSISIILLPSDYNGSSLISGPMSCTALFPQCIWFTVESFFGYRNLK